MYCWFDWDDNTTSIQSLSIIREPRKDWKEYAAGDEVVAKLPKYGMWRGVIVEIGESRKDLEAKMKMRQKIQAEMLVEEVEGTSEGTIEKDLVEAKEDLLAEKKKKKTLEKAKLAATNKEVENMLLERRTKKSSFDESLTQHEAPQTTDTLEPPEDPPAAQKETSETDESFQNMATTQQSTSHYPDSYWSPQNYHPYMYSGVQYQPNYSYLNDINSPPSPYTYTTLSSRSDMEEKMRSLVEENERLKEENQSLRSQLERRHILPDICATPSKIRFLKRLTTELETKQDTNSTTFTSTQVTVESYSNLQNQSREEVLPSGTPPAPTIVFKPKPLRFQPILPEEVDNDSDVEGETREFWEESVTSCGLKKIKLVADYDVWILPNQISMANHKAGGNPRKLVVNLLDVFFTRETLAASSAKGSRKAHNRSESEGLSKPLNKVVLGAIKTYVLNSFKKPNGEACLSDSTITDVINNKCATARRALKA